MEKINSIAIGKMNNGAHFEFITSVIGIAERDQAVSGFCGKELNALREARANEDAVMYISNKSPLTPQIAKADRERDKMFGILKGTARLWRGFPTEDIAKAADNVYERVIIYRISPKDQYDKQSGLLDNLIQELQGKYREDVRKIGLEQVVNTMKSANDTVRSLLIERSRESAGREIGRMRAARKASDKAYELFVTSVNAHAFMNGGREFDAFIAVLNQVIIRYKDQVLRQPTREPEASESDPVANLNLGAELEADVERENEGEE